MADLVERLRAYARTHCIKGKCAEEEAANEIVTLRKALESQGSKLYQRTEALRKLNAEASGLVGAFPEDIRETIGNTNMAVLEQRIREAEEALSDE